VAPIQAEVANFATFLYRNLSDMAIGGSPSIIQATSIMAATD
jgi:hypothetical protein